MRRKRIVAGTLVAGLALSVMPIFTGTASAQTAVDPIGAGNFCEDVPQTEPFTDVQSTDPAFGNIVCLVATEVTTGVTATTYEPNSPVTRRQMALFLTRLAVEADRLEVGDNINELPAAAAPAFSDVANESAAVKNAISQLDQADVAGGFPDGTYRPAAPVSRRQMAAFIDRLYEFLTGTELPATSDHFDDDDSDSAEAQESTNAVAEAGIFVGNSDGTFAPAQSITRRQMASVITRTFQVLLEKGEINQWSADTGVDTATERPELVSATIVSTTTQGTTVRYTFDEALTGNFVNAGDFHVYIFSNTGGSDDDGDLAQVDANNSSSVLVTFQSITTASGLGPQLSVATVDEGAVRGISGLVTDENIIGDAPLNPGGTSQLQSGITIAADLVSFGNFRSNPQDIFQTLVDVTFDEAAFDDCGGTGLSLLHTDGVSFNDSVEIVAGDETTVFTVAFDNNGFFGGPDSSVPISPTAVARGLSYSGCTEDSVGNHNPLQTADVSNGGNSETPDLVSAVAALNQPDANNTFGTGDLDAILFTFDEPVLVDDGTDFCAYLADSTEVCVPADPLAVRSTSNDTQVAAVFGPAGTLSTVVGAFVDIDGVTEATGGQNRNNQEDEVGIANVGTGPTTTSGRTAAPDLTGVAVTERRDPFGTLIGARVTYTFDEDVHTPVSGDFGIVLADGTIRTCAAGAVVGTTEETDNTVRCDDFGATTTTAQILAAAVGTVDDAAVNNQASGTNPGVVGTDTNPEGAELT